MNQTNKYSAALLDANIGSTNITGKKKIQSMVFNTFDTITATLQHHCGPYSAFALTHNVGDAISEPVFTNDGINIVKSMSFLNPIQDFARRNIAYIGSRVETKIGDGTTTAMIMASSFMKYMSDPNNIPLQEVLSQVSYTELVDLYNLTVSEIQTRINHDRIVVKKDDIKMLEKVAYCQAYTSSHGDKELSSAISGLFAALPVEAWPYIYYYREVAETNIRYRIKSDINQFTSKVTIMNKNMFNTKLGTEFARKGADVFVYTDLLTAGNELTWEPLRVAIQEAIMKESPLVILCPDTTDGFTRRSISDMLVEDTKHVVALFTHHMDHPKLNDFRILALLTKQQDLQAPYFVLHDVDVECKGHDLTINGIYKSNPDSIFNPLINDKDYLLYKQQVDEIKSLIDHAKEESISRDTINEITHYVSVYNRLLFQRKCMIVVGGLAYDNSAAMDVLTDTVNAVNRSLTEGYTGGANTALCRALVNLKKEYSDYSKYTNRDDIREHKLIYFIIESFLNALNDVYKGIDWNIMGYVPTANPIKLVANSSASDLYLIYDSENGWRLKEIWDTFDHVNIGDDISPVIQPADLIPEITTRIGEVCLKFLKTDNIISENGVYSPPRKLNWFKRLFKRGL